MSGVAKSATKVVKEVADASVGLLEGALDIVSPDINIPPPPPPPPEPEPMPVPDDAAIQAEQRRKYQKQRKTSGRASTILTGEEGALG